MLVDLDRIQAVAAKRHETTRRLFAMLGGAQVAMGEGDPTEYIFLLRSRMADAFLALLALVAVPLVTTSLLRAYSTGWLPIMNYHAGLLVLLWGILPLRKHMSYAVRASIGAGLVFLTGALGVWNFGLVGQGTSLLFVFCVLAIMFAGLRAGLMAIVLSAATFALAGYRIVGDPGVLRFDVYTYAVSKSAWNSAFFALVLYTSLLLIAVNYVYQALVEQLQEVYRRSLAQKAAQQEQRRLAMIVEQASEDISITDREGVMVYVNPAFERITGYSREEAVGQPAGILKSGLHDQAFYSHLWRTIRGGETWRGRLTNKRKGGELVEEDAVISPIRSESGAIEGYVAHKRDVTEQVRMELELRQTQKMNAIGTLAGGIAHDFNNILGAIMGFTEILRDDLPGSDASSRASLDAIMMASERARDLVRQILTFSRQGTQEMKEAAVDDIVREALVLIRSALPKSVEIRECIESGTYLGKVDPTQIHQVVMNLCTNAWHAMRGGGVLTVSLETVDLTELDTRRLAGLGPGRYLSLVVRDTGCGIEEAILEKIFDPFFTTKGRGEGTGLGLSVVHGIVTQHGGRIAARSQVGQGAEFEVLLPEFCGERGAVGPDRSPLPTGNERILVIDDDPALLRVVKLMLSPLGYAVQTDQSPMAAIGRFSDPEYHVDLVVTDLSMPKLNGLEVCARIHLVRPGLPFILCTGYPDEVEIDQRVQAGLSEVLMKPIGKREMAEAVRRVLDTARPRDGRSGVRNEST